MSVWCEATDTRDELLVLQATPFDPSQREESGHAAAGKLSQRNATLTQLSNTADR